jgi:serine protease AprX
VLLAGLVLAPIGAAAGPGGLPGRAPLDPGLRVHPYLQYGAQAEPNKRVRVIVQKAHGHLEDRDDDDPDVHEGEKFQFIESKVLELPLGKVAKLAANPSVRYVSLDGPVKTASIDVSQVKTTYPGTISLPKVWNGSKGLGATGNGVTVAVLDTGVNSGHPDFTGSKLVTVNVNPRALGGGDGHGHGTHVIGIVNGRDPYGQYIGVAPDARVISVKVADDTGASTTSDLLAGLQWVSDNRAAYNIRVVNLSINAALAESYLTSPLAAAVETLWLNGVVVVVASGNRGTDLSNQTWYAPANDPFVITVGALDENQTVGTTDDSLAYFSSRGPTQDGFYKPEIVAPGRKIVAPLSNGGSTLAKLLPDHIVDGNHIRLSGTSMAAPVVTGVVALLLERNPSLTPDQVKWLLQLTASAYPGKADIAGVVNPVAAIQTASKGKLGLANLGLALNPAVIASGGTALAQAYWNQAYWDAAYWNQAYWDTAYWDTATTFDAFAGE